MIIPENPIQTNLLKLYASVRPEDSSSVRALLVKHGPEVLFAHAYERNASVLLAHLGVFTLDTFLQSYETGDDDLSFCVVTDRGGQFHDLQPGAKTKGDPLQIQFTNNAPDYALNVPAWRLISPQARRETIRILQEALPGCEVR